MRKIFIILTVLLLIAITGTTQNKKTKTSRKQIKKELQDTIKNDSIRVDTTQFLIEQLKIQQRELDSLIQRKRK